MKMERIARRNGLLLLLILLILRQAKKQFMQNFRVNDLENLLKNYLMRVQL
jgi:hypothetical protein